jgi:predicted transcriptional regulator
LLGRAIRRARWNAQLTQEALGGRAGLSQSAISRIETGTVNGLRYATFIRILDGLSCIDLRLEVSRPGMAELVDRQGQPIDRS